MKKMLFAVVVVMVVSLVVFNYKKEDKEVRDEATYRREYVSKLSSDPKELASFLFVAGELDEFVEVNDDDRSSAIENAVAVFSEDEGISQEALNRAKEAFANVHIDSNWEEIDKPTPITSRAIIAETGEPISSKPAGPWLPPEDFLTEKEEEFRAQVIKAAELDENSSDFTEQLTKLYNATNSSDFPNYETYKLFIDRLATASENQ